MEFKKELNIFQRKLGIMSELSSISKEDKKVNGQYNFISHDAVSSAIHPMLVKWGLDSTPTVSDIKQDGNRTELKIQVTFTNVDKPEEKIIVDGYGYGIDGQDKGPGKAYSYAVKMIMLKFFCLESGEPDNERDIVTEHKKFTPKTLEKPTKTPEEMGQAFKKKGGL